MAIINKVTNGGGKSRDSGDFLREPGYFGEPETLKSGGATSDDYRGQSPQSSLEGGPHDRHVADNEPGRRHSGWPERSGP